MNSFLKTSVYLLLLAMLILTVETEAKPLDVSIDPEYRPLEYQGKTYYVHSANFSSFKAAIDSCTVDGAILAEINDAKEFKAIQKYLRTTKKIDTVFVGGTDQAKDGDWLLPSTNEELPFMIWGVPGEPSIGDYFDCLTLFVGFDWKMMSLWCSVYAPTYEDRFLCEI